MNGGSLQQAAIADNQIDNIWSIPLEREMTLLIINSSIIGTFLCGKDNSKGLAGYCLINPYVASRRKYEYATYATLSYPRNIVSCRWILDRTREFFTVKK
jgi:hypothetical protein